MGDGWANFSPELRAIIERVCTEKEIEVLQKKAAGLGWKAMSFEIGISIAAVRSRMHNAELKIRREVGAMRGVT